jgi:hypothetical protein
VSKLGFSVKRLDSAVGFNPELLIAKKIVVRKSIADKITNSDIKARHGKERRTWRTEYSTENWG